MVGPGAELGGLPGLACRLATHVDLVAPAGLLDALAPALTTWAAANPCTVVDLYLLGDAAAPPAPARLRAWRRALPHTPGYLDRVAVYATEHPAEFPALVAHPHARVSPRLFLVLPWSAQADPADYAGVAELVWGYDAPPGEALPLGAWRAAGGAGICLAVDPAAPPAEAAALLAEASAWAEAEGRLLFHQG